MSSMHAWDIHVYHTNMRHTCLKCMPEAHVSPLHILGTQVSPTYMWHTCLLCIYEAYMSPLIYEAYMSPMHRWGIYVSHAYEIYMSPMHVWDIHADKLLLFPVTCPMCLYSPSHLALKMVEEIYFSSLTIYTGQKNVCSFLCYSTKYHKFSDLKHSTMTLSSPRS